MATTPTSNPIPSEDPRDLKFNAGKVDEFVNSLSHQYSDRFGRGRYTIEGLRWLAQQAIAQYGWIPVGTFQAGATLTLPNQILKDETDGEYYRWDGVLPKIVPAGSTPGTTGGFGTDAWLSVGDSTLRAMLASDAGAAAIGAEDGRTVQEWIIALDSAEYRARNIMKLAWVDKQVHSRGGVKVLFQGDSITAGYDVVTSDSIAPVAPDWARHATMTYPQRFAEFMGEQAGVDVTPVIRAISGYTAKQAYEYPDWQTNPGCDVAILMYGINDAAGVEGQTESSYMMYMERLIRRFIDWGMGVVIATCASGGMGAFNHDAQLWSKRARMMAEVYGCSHFDGTEVHYYRHEGAVVSDGTHFNSMGYAILGQALGSMFMAGGILPSYRPLNNELTTWPGRFNDSVGYCDARGTVDLSRLNTGTFTRSKILGRIPASTAGLMTFSFYLDADAAHIFYHGTGDGPLTFITDAPAWWNNGAQDYYQYAGSQVVNYATAPQADPNTNNGLPATYGPDRKFVGRILGRGWKTVTVYTPQNGTGGEAYLNSLTVQPVPVGHSIQAVKWREWNKGIKSVYQKKIPFPYGASTAPAATSLITFAVPAPQSLLPVTPGISGDINGFPYNSGHATIKITSTAGDYVEAVFMKSNGSNDYVFTGRIIHSTFASGVGPTGIDGTLSHIGIKTLKAAGTNGTGQPQEAINDIDPVAISSLPAAGNGGLYLNITVQWPASPPQRWWTVEIESWDIWGSSEPSI